jgi:PKD repeat protein
MPAAQLMPHAPIHERRVVVPPDLDGEQILRLQDALHRRVSLQHDLARCPFVLRVASDVTREPDGRSFLLRHEPAAPPDWSRLTRPTGSDLSSLLEMTFCLTTALQRAHEHESGAVHGALCPGCILLASSVWKVTDFGIGTALNEVLGPERFRELAVASSTGESGPGRWEWVTRFKKAEGRIAAYLSLDQWDQDDYFTYSSDLFALATLLYERVTWAHPHARSDFDGSDFFHCRSKFVEEYVPAGQAIRDRWPDLEEPALVSLCSLLDRILDPDHEKPIKDAKTLLEGLLAIDPEVPDRIEQLQEKARDARRQDQARDAGQYLAKVRSALAERDTSRAWASLQTLLALDLVDEGLRAEAEALGQAIPLLDTWWSFQATPAVVALLGGQDIEPGEFPSVQAVLDQMDANAERLLAAYVPDLADARGEVLRQLNGRRQAHADLEETERHLEKDELDQAIQSAEAVLANDCSGPEQKAAARRVRQRRASIMAANLNLDRAERAVQSGTWEAMEAGLHACQAVLGLEGPTASQFERATRFSEQLNEKREQVLRQAAIDLAEASSLLERRQFAQADQLAARYETDGPVEILEQARELRRTIAEALTSHRERLAEQLKQARARYDEGQLDAAIELARNIEQDTLAGDTLRSESSELLGTLTQASEGRDRAVKALESVRTALRELAAEHAEPDRAEPLLKTIRQAAEQIRDNEAVRFGPARLADAAGWMLDRLPVLERAQTLRAASRLPDARDALDQLLAGLTDDHPALDLPALVRAAVNATGSQIDADASRMRREHVTGYLRKLLARQPEAPPLRIMPVSDVAADAPDWLSRTLDELGSALRQRAEEQVTGPEDGSPAAFRKVCEELLDGRPVGGEADRDDVAAGLATFVTELRAREAETQLEKARQALAGARELNHARPVDPDRIFSALDLVASEARMASELDAENVGAEAERLIGEANALGRQVREKLDRGEAQLNEARRAAENQRWRQARSTARQVIANPYVSPLYPEAEAIIEQADAAPGPLSGQWVRRGAALTAGLAIVAVVAIVMISRGGNGEEPAPGGGNAGPAVIDTQAPFISETNLDPESSPTELDEFRVTFSEKVAGVRAESLTINGQPATDGAVSPLDEQDGFASRYIFRVNRTMFEGEVVLALAGNGIRDRAGNQFAGQSWTWRTPERPEPAPNQPPVAQFTATPSQGEAPLTVAFDASGSSDDGEIRSYAWSFGEGSPGEGQQVQHRYENAGVYTVTLTVTDDQGTSSEPVTRTVTVAASNQPPTAVMQVTENGNPVAGGEIMDADGDGRVTVNLDASESTDPEGGALRFRWAEGTNILAEGPQATFQREFAIENDAITDHTITLTVTDAAGLQATAEATVRLLPMLKVNATAEPGTIVVGRNTTLRATAEGGDPGSPATYTYAWTPTTGLSDAAVAEPTATPAATATYTVTVTDTDGRTASANVTVTVHPVLQVSAGPDQQIQTGQQVTLQGSAQGGVPPYTYAWTPAGGLSDPAVAQPTVTPTATTTFTLTVTDAGGQNGQDTVDITVQDPRATLETQLTQAYPNAGPNAPEPLDENTAWGFLQQVAQVKDVQPAASLSVRTQQLHNTLMGRTNNRVNPTRYIEYFWGQDELHAFVWRTDDSGNLQPVQAGQPQVVQYYRLGSHQAILPAIQSAAGNDGAPPIGPTVLGPIVQQQGFFAPTGESFGVAIAPDRWLNQVRLSQLSFNPVTVQLTVRDLSRSLNDARGETWSTQQVARLADLCPPTSQNVFPATAVWTLASLVAGPNEPQAATLQTAFRKLNQQISVATPNDTRSFLQSGQWTVENGCLTYVGPDNYPLNWADPSLAGLATIGPTVSSALAGSTLDAGLAEPRIPADPGRAWFNIVEAPVP